MAQKYIFTDPPTEPMGIQELVNFTDWTDEDIETIVKLEVGGEYKGLWEEPGVLRRVS